MGAVGSGSGSGYGYGDGYGDGSGSGYGSGSGSGDGYGYGYGSGSGDGYGSGSGSGYGSGSGSGSGYGDGYGSGSGSGDGYGDGYGSGSGSGDGYGYGSGYGDGSGDGSGYGYGYGYGSGSGYGDGSGSLKEAIQGFIAQLPAERKARVKKLQRDGATLAYWRSTKEGKPANGGTGDAVTVGMVQKVKGPLNLCEKGTLHATYIPSKWQGPRIWLVAMIGKVEHTDDKMGALEREIIADITPGTQ